MELKEFVQIMQPEIERRLQDVIDQSVQPDYAELRSMLRYHLGWEGAGAGPEAQGKRIRPLLVLLSTVAAGGDWHAALPAAAAVELIHNFSLIHDDIQDRSELRRGRQTVWVKWGVAQAINAGDLMFTLAHLSLLDLAKTQPPEAVVKASQVLHETCISLTKGQFLDLYNENEPSMPIDSYWPMVGGKTAALLAASLELGAIVAQVDAERREAFRRFGYQLGLAFQMLDDLLGIWGDAGETGKSTESDLVSGKKTLPVLYGLRQGGQFAQRWMSGPIQAAEVPEAAGWLVEDGARAYTQREADRLTKEALQSLDESVVERQAGEALRSLALLLLKRKN